MHARIHNAKRCTLNGADLWLGVIYRGRGMCAYSSDLSPEFDTLAECEAWCRVEMARRGEPNAPVTVEE